MPEACILIGVPRPDVPPKGYLDWSAWADEKVAAGQEQVQCRACMLWRFPDEALGEKCKRVGGASNATGGTKERVPCAACQSDVYCEMNGCQASRGGKHG